MPTEVTCGGNALKFYASVRLNIRRTGLVKKGEVVNLFFLFLFWKTMDRTKRNISAILFVKRRLFRVYINLFTETLYDVIGFNWTTLTLKKKLVENKLKKNDLFFSYVVVLSYLPF